MRGGLVSWRAWLAASVAVVLLAPPLLHNHPPACGTPCGGGGEPELAVDHHATGGPSHCPACAAGPPAAGLMASSRAASPQPSSLASPSPCPLRVTTADPEAGSARAPPRREPISHPLT